MRAVLMAVLGLLLVGATVVGIVTASHEGQRPSVGSPRSQSGLVLYGGR